jgi:hypothetical protein
MLQQSPLCFSVNSKTIIPSSCDNLNTFAPLRQPVLHSSTLLGPSLPLALRLSVLLWLLAVNLPLELEPYASERVFPYP